MKQRFGIAQALIGQPKLIIVDEPTAGLDPEERLRFYNILSEIGEEVTVLLSTHIVSDVSDLCQSFAVLYKGEVRAYAKPNDAVKSIEGKIWSCIIKKEEVRDFERKYKVLSSKFTMGQILIKVYSNQNPDSNFLGEKPTLEDFYFSHIKGYLQ